MATVRIGVSGAAGRMGRRIVALAAGRRDLVVACALERPGAPEIGHDAGTLAGVAPLGVALRERLASGACDVLIDFSAPAALSGRLKECLSARIAFVVGTTGLSPAARVRLATAARTIPVLAAPNMSLGANILQGLVENASRALASWRPDVEIVELHHARKKDSPSGTALWLADAVEKGAARAYRRVYGRRGLAGPRSEIEIGIHAIRAGSAVGEHAVYFAVGSERIELVHRVESRDAFAQGALAAAVFLASRKGKPGFYTMGDVLCLPNAPRSIPGR